LPAPPGDVLGAALRTATEQPSTVLRTGAKQETSAAQNSGETVDGPAVSTIDRRLAKLKRKLGGGP
jgi:hypothetical protein